MNFIRGKSWIVPISCFLLALALSSCAGQLSQRPKAWIDCPHEGDAFSLGNPITVISHGFGHEGVAEIVLSVNGIAYRHDLPSEVGSEFVSVQQEWNPVEAGNYTLQVQVYDSQGQISNPAIAAVRVVGTDPTPAISDTPVATITQTTTATSPPPTDPPPTIPPPTEPPPTHVPPTERPPTQVPPTEPPPTTPPDTTPPPTPGTAVPADGLVLSCRSTQTLAWIPVPDPSGIAGYYVRLELEITKGQWKSVGKEGPIQGKQVDVDVQCGGNYRWMVRARDNAGNFSDWSAPSYFSINLG